MNNVQQLHAYDCHQNVPDHSTTSGHRYKYYVQHIQELWVWL